MRLVGYLLVVFVLVSCNEEKQFVPRSFSEVEIAMILEDSTLSVRAIEILKDSNLAFAGNNNAYGIYNVQTKNWRLGNMEFDSIDLQFRATARTTSDFFMLSIANPALLFKTTNQGMQLVYNEEHESVFYDAMDFWNDLEGIAIGDPTEDCMSIIITRDGGETWNKLSCDDLPKSLESEAAFAASDTNIAIVGDHTWVATGGKASRVLYSPDKGETWEVFNTPIIQGKETTGIYSIDFYDEQNGFAIGGDYTQPDDNSANKIRTKDGGRTWEIVGSGKEPGYRSCVQYFSERNGRELVVIGFNGIDYSNDGGYTWKHLSDEGFYTLRFLNDSTAYAAGKGRIAKLVFKE